MKAEREAAGERRLPSSLSGEAKGKRIGMKASPTQKTTLSPILHKLRLQWQKPSTERRKRKEKEMVTEQKSMS